MISVIVQGFKFIWLLLTRIAFKNKNEGDISHKDFNPRAFIILVLLFMALSYNLVLSYRHYELGNNYVQLHEKVTKQCPDVLKNNVAKIPKP